MAALSPQYNLSFQKIYQLVYALIEFQLAIFPATILNSDSLQWCTKLRFVLQTTFVLHLNTTMIRHKLNKASRQIFCLNRFIRIQFRFLSVMNRHFMLHISCSSIFHCIRIRTYSISFDSYWFFYWFFSVSHCLKVSGWGKFPLKDTFLVS